MTRKHRITATIKDQNGDVVSNEDYDGRTYGLAFRDGEVVIDEAFYKNKTGRTYDDVLKGFQTEMDGYVVEDLGSGSVFSAPDLTHMRDPKTNRLRRKAEATEADE